MKTAVAGSRARLYALAGAALVVAVVALANAHLVYVSFASEPDCVRHIRAGTGPGTSGGYAAAQSACTPQTPTP